MSTRSPVVAVGTFSLPFASVVKPSPFVSDSTNGADAPESESAENDAQEILNAALAPPVVHAGPIAVIGRFINLGRPRDNPGIRHTLFFSRRPTSDVYSLSEQTFKVSGYLSYNYLLSGATVVGVVFSSDNSRSTTEVYKLVVRSADEPRNFTPNFNLEKSGLMMFVSDNSSTLVIPTELDSSLVVRTD